MIVSLSTMESNRIKVYVFLLPVYRFPTIELYESLAMVNRKWTPVHGYYFSIILP